MTKLKNQITNYFLKPHRANIEILSNDYPGYFSNVLKKFDIKLNTDENIHQLIAWDDIEHVHTFFCDYEGSDKEVSAWLRKSDLNDSQFLIIELGYELPIIKVECQVFMENWEDFVAASGYTGITVIDENGRFYMEFVDEGKNLFSNFKIQD
ncbi:hypothetical protein GCM10009118_07330 [Wandonia haliotis]|uniref:DUF2750 domain-containing protein n=1 Tax=Wandonia haliotis TaxID=574963 RepID=A0ABN1MM59_9FLAO